MTTIIRKATPADLLAALPELVGRDPRESVALIAFRGKRTHAALRFDIPRSGIGTFAATAVGTFCRIEGADDVVPIVCSDAPADAHEQLLATLVSAFRRAGFPVRDALALGSDGWSSHLDPDRRVHPRAEVEAAMRALGLEPPLELPDRVPRADELACRRMADHLVRLAQPEADDELEPLDDLPFFAERALSWTGSEFENAAALLLLAVQSPPVRDLVMLQWAFGLDLGDALWTADTCAALEARKSYPDVDELAAELMLGRGPAPDGDRIEAAVALLTALIARADDSARPAPLCMLAWLTWALGRGSAAGTHVDEVRALAPEYGMGQLLDTMLGAGALPDWIFQRF